MAKNITWEDTYNSMAFACWKVMLKKHFRLGDYSKDANDLGHALYEITKTWPKEYRKNLYAFCKANPIKQEILITKILSL